MPIKAQAAPADSYTVVANTQPVGSQPDNLELRQDPTNPAVISGTIQGDRIEGFFAANTGQIIWVRFSGNVASQVYVGAFQQDNIDRLGVAREIQGVVYALNIAGGASEQRNAFGFYAGNRLIRRQIPPLRSADPANSPTPNSQPYGAWWASANTDHAALVIETEAYVPVSGFIFGDPIVGSYARHAGTIAFLRFRGNRPIQFYQASSNRRLISLRQGTTWEFNGTVLALNAEGGASGNDLGLPFTAKNKSEGYLYISPVGANGCLGFDNNSLLNAAMLVLIECGNRSEGYSGRANFAKVKTNDNATVLVARHSGRCLEIPGGQTRAGYPVQQYDCHGGRNQRVQFRRVLPARESFCFVYCQQIFLQAPLCLSNVNVFINWNLRVSGIVTADRCSNPREDMLFVVASPI